jgi:pyruvate-formate lyase-activating enzyme
VPPLELVPYHRLGEHKYRLLGREYALAGTVPVDTEGVERLCHYLRTMGLSCSALSH